MTLIDADTFLEYLIFSKHIDSLKCGEVREAVEMSKVDVLDKIRAEIKQLPYQRIFGNVSSYSLLDAVIEIIDKYRESEDET